jgi:hypothetical protein
LRLVKKYCLAAGIEPNRLGRAASACAENGDQRRYPETVPSSSVMSGNCRDLPRW